MLCPICKKENASLEVSRFINDRYVLGFVCEHCYDIAISLDVNRYYYYFVALKNKSCPVCGRTYEEFSKTLLLGCPNCYNVFAQELKPLVDRIQK